MIRISQFAGEIPRLIPRLLPGNHAQIAQNSKMENGALTPIRRGRFEHHLDQISRTIYRHNGEWLSWPGFVDVAPAPIAEDRLYVTGDGAPKMIVGGVIYPLAVPRPTAPPTISLTGVVDPDTSSTVLYAYTFVTAFDEESEPSPVSNSLLWSPGLDITITGIQIPPSGRAINRIRIYRSQTSALGDTQLYFVKELPAGTFTWVDVVADNPIQEPIPSTSYNPPPDGLRGIKAMPNGMMVAFMGKKVYFCEPYRPHAWPEKYILTVDYNVVGLGVSGSSVAILTEGQPYVAVGITPDAMAMEKLPANLPCISNRAIVDLGTAVAYPSTRGLVVVNQAGASVATEALLTRDQWQEMNPYSFVAGQYAGRYMASYAYAGADGVEKRGILIIDLTQQQPFILRASDDADAMFHEIGTGNLYLLRNGQEIWEWDPVSEPYGEQLWRSKKFVLPGHTNFGFILIEGEDVMTEDQRAELAAKNAAKRAANRQRIDNADTGGSIGERALGLVTFAGSLLDPVEESEVSFGVTVYADGRPVAEVYEMNKPVRLPGGFLATTWEVEVRGNQQITAITLAGSIEELIA